MTRAGSSPSTPRDWLSADLAAGLSSWSVLGSRLVLAAALIGVTACYALHSLDVGDTEYGEGPILAMVERMQREQVSPAWLDGPEYTLSCYGPLYYWGVRAVSALWPWEQSLAPGRLLSLAAGLATAALVAVVVRRETGSIELGLLSASILLTCPVVGLWTTRHRVDALAMFFGVAAYAAMGHRLQEGTDASRRPSSAALPASRFGASPLFETMPRARIILSALCIVVGALVKQTVALTAIPLVVYLLLQRRYRVAVAYALLVAALGTAAWLTLIGATGGYYFTGAIQGNLNGFSLRQGTNNARDFLATPAVLVAIIVMAYRTIENPLGVAKSLYGLGFALGSAIAALLSCKEGASSSYFMEAHALAVLVIALYGLPLFWNLHRGRCAALAALLGLVVAEPHLRYLSCHALVCDDLLRGGANVVTRLKGSAGSYMLSDGKCVDLLLRSGARPLINDPYLFRLLVDNGGISPAKAVETIQRGEISHLVLNRSLTSHEGHIGSYKQKWPPAILAAMKQHFALEYSDELHDLFIYKYSPRSEAPPSERTSSKLRFAASGTETPTSRASASERAQAGAWARGEAPDPQSEIPNLKSQIPNPFPPPTTQRRSPAGA